MRYFLVINKTPTTYIHHNMVFSGSDKNLTQEDTICTAEMIPAAYESRPTYNGFFLKR